MSHKKIKQRKRVSVDTKDMLAGIQALTVFYENKVNLLNVIRGQLGEEHAAVMDVQEELILIGDILNHFSNLVGDQLKDDKSDNLN